MSDCVGIKNLYKCLYEDMGTNKKPFISITGGGGKTTLMIGLAKFLKEKGKTVLITTTTKLISPYLLDYGQDKVFSDESILNYVPNPQEVVFYAHISQEDKKDKEDNKWCSPGFDNLAKLYEIYDVIISEADGSKHLPVKIHTFKDPQIHPLTTFTISVFGMWALNCKTCEVAFGPSIDSVVDSSYMTWYFSNPDGILKGTIPYHRAVVFNGADLRIDNLQDDIKLINNIKRPKDVKIYISTVREGILYAKL